MRHISIPTVALRMILCGPSTRVDFITVVVSIIMIDRPSIPIDDIDIFNNMNDGRFILFFFLVPNQNKLFNFHWHIVVCNVCDKVFG